MARERTEETHTQTLHTTPTEQKKNKSHDRPVETKVVLWERLTVDKQMFCQWSKLAEKKSGDSLIGMPTDKVETQRIRLPIECIFERHSTERKYKNLWAFFSLVSFASLGVSVVFMWFRGQFHTIERSKWFFVCPCTGYNHSQSHSLWCI